VGFGYLLAVVEQRVVKPGRQYYCRGKYRTRKASPTRLIATGLYKPFAVITFEHSCKVITKTQTIALRSTVF